MVTLVLLMNKILQYLNMYMNLLNLQRDLNYPTSPSYCPIPQNLNLCVKPFVCIFSSSEVRHFSTKKWLQFVQTCEFLLFFRVFSLRKWLVASIILGRKKNDFLKKKMFWGHIFLPAFKNTIFRIVLIGNRDKLGFFCGGWWGCVENHMLYVEQSKYLDVVNEGYHLPSQAAWKNWLRRCLAAGDKT